MSAEVDSETNTLDVTIAPVGTAGTLSQNIEAKVIYTATPPGTVTIDGNAASSGYSFLS